MTRIPTTNPDNASTEQKQILAGVKQALGIVPNLVSTLAHSPAAAHAYLAFSGALAKGSLNSRLREQIALVVGQTNSCDYCVAAHTLLGGKTGLSQEDLLAARLAKSNDKKTESALQFARKLVQNRGVVDSKDVDNLRENGFTDGDIAEIVANTALNLFTNYFNHVAGTVIDFPPAPPLS